MIRRLLHSETRNLSTAAMIIAAASLVSRIVGILRDRILAGEFGAGEELDIYYAAFRIPDLLFSLLVLGALSAGFIPLFTRLNRDSGSSKGWEFANAVLTLFIIFFALLSLLLLPFVPAIVALIAPGFSASAKEETMLLTRLMLLSPLFLGVSSIFSGILHSFRRFFVTAIAPIFYNVGIILGALFLVPSIGLPGLAWGVLVGAFLHAAIQFPTVVHLGFRYSIRWAWDGALRELFHLMIPRTATLAITHAVLLVMTALASQLREGSLAAFNLANNLQSFPIGIFGVSYAIAVFPAMSAAVAGGNRQEFLQQFSSSTRQILFFLIPSTVLFLTLKAQIVRVLLGSGAFDWEDTVVTFQTLEAFSVGLVAQALLFLLVRAFWAYTDTLRPALIALLSAIITIALGITFQSSLGVRGLALAFAFGAIVHVVALWVVLHRKVGSLDERRIFFSFAQMLVASVYLGVIVQVLKGSVEPYSGTQTFVGIFIQGALAAFVGLVGYCGVLFVLGSSEVRLFFQSIGRRMGWVRATQMELFEEL